MNSMLESALQYVCDFVLVSTIWALSYGGLPKQSRGDVPDDEAFLRHWYVDARTKSTSHLIRLTFSLYISAAVHSYSKSSSLVAANTFL